jgi:hypothetical protein
MDTITSVRDPRHERKSNVKRVHLSKDVLARMGVGDKLYDDEVSGFFVVRGKQGWSFRAHADLPTRVMRERLTGAPTIVVTIGRFPSTSIKHARTEARRVIAEIKDGRDPRDPKLNRNALTLREAFEQYKAIHMANNERRPNTYRNYEYAFRQLRAGHDKPMALIAKLPLVLEEEHARLTRECGKSTANAALALWAMSIVSLEVQTAPNAPNFRCGLTMRSPGTRARVEKKTAWGRTILRPGGVTFGQG